MPPTRAGLSPTPRRLLMCAVASASEGSWGAVSESGRLRQGAAGPREAPQRANVAYAPVASASEGSWGAVSESGRLRQGAAGPREAPQRANVAYAPPAL